MTPNLAEVRAAAEIVRYWLSHPDADEPTMEEQEERGHAAQHIADYILSHIPDYILSHIHADDHLPVTADWLREEWGAAIKPPCIGIQEFWIQAEKQKLFGLIYSDGSVSAGQISITTRHQFRQLAGILGIQPKK